MDLEPGVYKVVFDGAEGSGSFALKRKGRIQARGRAFEKLVAMSNPNIVAARRLAAFEAKSRTITQAEARLRMFELETHLTENDVAQHRP